MYSVTAKIDQLNWQKLENRRNNSCLCLLFKIMQHQNHAPTDDIPPPVPTTIMRSSHERKCHMRGQMYTNIHSFHTQLLYGINYKKQSQKLSH